MIHLLCAVFGLFCRQVIITLMVNGSPTPAACVTLDLDGSKCEWHGEQHINGGTITALYAEMLSRAEFDKRTVKEKFRLEGDGAPQMRDNLSFGAVTR